MIVVVIVVGVLVVAALFDRRARRHGSTPRRGQDIGREIRQQEVWTKGRQSGNFRGGEDTDGTFSPDREKRLGR